MRLLCVTKPYLPSAVQQSVVLLLFSSPWCCSCSAVRGVAPVQQSVVLLLFSSPWCCSCSAVRGVAPVQQSVVLLLFSSPWCCSCSAVRGVAPVQQSVVLLLRCSRRDRTGRSYQKNMWLVRPKEDWPRLGKTGGAYCMGVSRIFHWGRVCTCKVSSVECLVAVGDRAISFFINTTILWCRDKTRNIFTC